jgi:hypothetical protein
MRHLAFLYGLLALLLLRVALLDAQDSSCEPLRPSPTGSSLRYMSRGKPDGHNVRCEGLYEEDYGAKSLALVSFTLGTINYPLQAGTKVELTVPKQSADVHVRAIAKPANVAYEMDAVLAPGSTLVWPVDDVLLPENLNDKQVGVFAWRGENTKKVYVPVRAAAPGSAPSPDSKPLITFRPSFDAQAVKWRWAAATKSGCSVPGSWADANPAQVDAGQATVITLPQAAGSYCLDVAAQGSGRDWVPLNLRVEIP